MTLDEVLDLLDRATANLAKLEAVWLQAEPHIPKTPSAGSNPEYDDLSRAWLDLLPGLPAIHGWTITEPLPDIDEVGRSFMDYSDIGELPFAVWEVSEQPGKDIAEYRYRLGRARRDASRRRLQQLITVFDTVLPDLVDELPGASSPQADERVDTPRVTTLTTAFREIERLLAGTAPASGRWFDLQRHMRFGQAHDWRDIADLDWPDVRTAIEAAAYSDTDPLPVPEGVDLGEVSAADPTGAATVALPWGKLTDDAFERLLFDLLRGIDGYENVQWLMQTRAPDRGRDLSLEHVIRDGTGTVRRERIIVQAKHWQSRSVRDTEIQDTLTRIDHWTPPPVHALVIATSGRFTQDAVALAERRALDARVPRVDLWPESFLETLLHKQPHLAVIHGLR